MTDITRKAWEVFRSAFKDGEDVIVEKDDGRFFYGKLKADDKGVLLTRAGKRSSRVYWAEIEFICHAGFPVEPIMGMTPQEAERRALQEPAEIVIAALEGTLETTGELPTRPYRSEPRRFWGGGCPFVAGPAELVTVHNRGNRSDRFIDTDVEEMLVFVADDGAVMHSWDSDHLFLKF